MKYTPENVNRLEPNQVFVFGSNLAGRHGKGAAKIALNKYGARYGVGRGLQGQSYALPTKDFEVNTLSLVDIEAEIFTFLNFADNNRQYEFIVTKIGCGLAGYKVEQIAKLFAKWCIPINVILPEEFWKVILETGNTI
jgi:hypothetical protein